jgi:hypothetical protein
MPINKSLGINHPAPYRLAPGYNIKTFPPVCQLIPFFICKEKGKLVQAGSFRGKIFGIIEKELKFLVIYIIIKF